jgi:predicted MPP superfamily phosphohydrolase
MTWALYGLAWLGAIGGPVALFLVWRDARRRRGGAWSARRKGLTGLCALLWCLGVWGFLIEPELLVVRRVTIESAAWRGPPLRVGLISDTHVGGPHVDAARVGRVVARMNAEKPDLVVLLGDYVGGHGAVARHDRAFRHEVDAGIAAFAGLDAPLGAIAVFGNHDWWYGDVAIARAFAAAKIPLLENESVPVSTGGRTFWVAGMPDYVSRRAQPDFDFALRHAPADADVIAIVHRPDVFALSPPRVAVTLAAHSHCGQVNLPLVGRVFAASPGSARWPCGAYDEGGRKLYVTGGVGVSILPVRFNQPPEIVVVTLKAAAR